MVMISLSVIPLLGPLCAQVNPDRLQSLLMYLAREPYEDHPELSQELLEAARAYLATLRPDPSPSYARLPAVRLACLREVHHRLGEVCDTQEEIRQAWLDWLMAFNKKYSPYNFRRGMGYPAGNAELFLQAVNTVLSTCPEQRRFLHVAVLGMPPRALGNSFNLLLKPLMVTFPHLEQVQFHFVDGSWAAVTRKGSGQFEYSSSAVADSLSDVPYEPEAEETAVHLLSTWEAGTEAPPFSAVFAKPPKRPPPFKTLWQRARKLRCDVRTLIVSANRYYYPKLPETLWSTELYPIYLGKTDLPYVRYYLSAEPHCGVGSLGWLIWAAQKNPLAYQSHAQFASALSLSEVSLDALKRNARRNGPFFDTLSELASVTRTMVDTWIEASNATYHPELPLAAHVLGLSIFIEPTSDDVIKLARLKPHEESLVKYLFALRKAHGALAQLEAYANHFGRNRSWYERRENGEIAVRRNNLIDWVHFFVQLAALPLLKALAEAHYQIEPNDPAYLLAEAVAAQAIAAGHTDLTIEAVALRSGVDSRGITKILTGKSRPLAQTVLALKRAYPLLDATRLYADTHPEMYVVFPELSSERLALRLTQVEIAAAARLDFRRELYARQMDPTRIALPGFKAPTVLNKSELGRLLGVSPSVYRDCLFLFQRIGEQRTTQDNDYLIMRVATVLGIAPRILYLHFYPELLRLFPIEDPVTGKTLEPSEDAYQNFLEESDRSVDRSNLRPALHAAIDRLALARSLDASDTPRAALLATLLEIDETAAQRLLDGRTILNQADIELLSGAPLQLDYRHWYEHFNRPRLCYFLSQDDRGAIDYTLPHSLTWSDLEAIDPQTLRETAYRLIENSSLTGKERAALKHSLKDNLERRDSLTDETIVRLGRLGMDTRRLFLWSNRRELAPIIAG